MAEYKSQIWRINVREQTQARTHSLKSGGVLAGADCWRASWWMKWMRCVIRWGRGIN
ncbi:hypothetical protein [Candidatus Villigracilis saccharophilus]|uniref:hypothetical protein n=1 Tax=Candidatus Villigracilis saccharophilus TaxID=3140684 RepID=UPI0031E9C4E8